MQLDRIYFIIFSASWSLSIYTSLCACVDILLMQVSIVRSHDLLMNVDSYWKCSSKAINRIIGNTQWVGILECKHEDMATEWLPIVISFLENIIWCCSLVDVTPSLGWTTYIGALMCIIYYVSWCVLFLCPWMFLVDLFIYYDENGWVTYLWMIWMQNKNYFYNG